MPLGAERIAGGFRIALSALLFVLALPAKAEEQKVHCEITAAPPIAWGKVATSEAGRSTARPVGRIPGVRIAVLITHGDGVGMSAGPRGRIER